MFALATVLVWMVRREPMDLSARNSCSVCQTLGFDEQRNDVDVAGCHSKCVSVALGSIAVWTGWLVVSGKEN